MGGVHGKDLRVCVCKWSRSEYVSVGLFMCAARLVSRDSGTLTRY